jgi:hypothetical protein
LNICKCFFVAILPPQHPPPRWHETTRYGFYFMPGVKPPTRCRWDLNIIVIITIKSRLTAKRAYLMTFSQHPIAIVLVFVFVFVCLSVDPAKALFQIFRFFPLQRKAMLGIGLTLLITDVLINGRQGDRMCLLQHRPKCCLKQFYRTY